LNLWKIAELLDGFTESKSEESSASDSDESLFCLIVFSVWVWFFYKFLIISDEVIDTLRYITQGVRIFSFTVFHTYLTQSIDTPSPYETDKERCTDIASTSSSYEVECYYNRCHNEYRSEIWLQYKEQEYHAYDEEKWDKSLKKIIEKMSLPLRKVGENDDDTYLHKLNRLYRGKEWYIEPSLSTIVFFSEEQHSNKEHKSYRKYILCVLF
jgi:hypothetical protein